jgi:putative peptidoglycan lipid II flippase
MEEPYYLQRFLKISIPILLGGATLQFYFIVHRVFATYLDDGTLAAINYASKLVQLPQTILVTAITTVIYPLISRTISEGNSKKLNEMYNDGLKLLYINLKPYIMLIILIYPMCQCI